MLHLTVVRHGSTEWNEGGRFQGWGDLPLSERGRREAALLGERLRGERFDRVIASDLRRARETAAIALPGVVAETDERLREIHFGAWDGLTWDECVARDGDLVSAWVEDPAAACPPGGETVAGFEARIAAAVDEIPRDGGRVLLAVHGGVVLALLARWLEVPLRRVFALHVASCGITRAELHPGGGVRILCVNDTAHMAGEEPVPYPAPSGEGEGEEKGEPAAG